MRVRSNKDHQQIKGGNKLSSFSVYSGAPGVSPCLLCPSAYRGPSRVGGGVRRTEMSLYFAENRKISVFRCLRQVEQGMIHPEINKNGTTQEDQIPSASMGSGFPITGNDPSDVDWEDGTVSGSYHTDDQPDMLGTGVTIELSESPSLGQQRTIRRASAEDKILAELVHKVHLLSLIARGRLVDSACGDPLIQASLLSLLPCGILKALEVPKLTINRLVPLVNWFRTNFCVKSASPREGDLKTNLLLALGTREGTAEEVAALSVALFRALNLSARFVSILDVASLKPDADVSGCSNQDLPQLDTKISSSSSSKIKVNSNNDSASCPGLASSRKLGYKIIGPESAQRGQNKSTSDHWSNSEIIDTSNDNACDDHLDACRINHQKKLKRKGDVEFELQLEMALSATAVGPSECNLSSDMNDICGSSDGTSSFKKLKKTERGEFLDSSQGPPLYWAEVYCGGETSSGKWVHVDQVESASAASRRPLKYAVAFAGFGAKDVTRRYCTHWYKIASQRINASWWDGVLAPLKQLESAATGDESSQIRAENLDLASGLQREMTEEGGSELCSNLSFGSFGLATRESLEDMELAIKGLTEPLPVNQQAYRKHHLYAIERFLSKYQVLYPKGPVLGYCSGHPVYPRACVQTLQTKQKWLREGLQVKANEVPAKVVKSSQKLGRRQHSEESAFVKDDENPMIELYGKWQVETLHLPPAVDGIVPKNERGQVEVWSERCLPPGTIHLRLPRLVPVVKRLDVDFAPAMVGFEFRNGRSFLSMMGLWSAAYAEEEERREAEEKKRREAQALSRWYQLLCSLITRQRLKSTYLDLAPDNLAEEQVNQPNSGHNPSHGRRQRVSLKAAGRDPLPGGDHEHSFPIEDQSFDKESSIRTKRCSCGFSIQMEEL
ncbi:unnamed protein product [Spirodela intermedia]|uniref:Uncharacterized protein n=1 Tax=Spirodela intermedia TaxID=51605 RepID=A0A7I8J4W2_SPIIN|nr:unnamed protein product [Spirodela intermedia]CAA6664805.1 unnamed protein product [Spirodela intermedia]